MAAAQGARRLIFSGIQPTGALHLGNYCGAVRQWVALQGDGAAAAAGSTGAACAAATAGQRRSEQGGDALRPPHAQHSHTHAFGHGHHESPRPGHRVVLSIVDLHAMTMPFRPAALASGTRLMAASLLACGVDPARAILFRQSDVREHAELAWVLGCITPLGWLRRMTQYKEKSGAARDTAGLGLLSYPVLQAADVLLYRATDVPVGEDQHQHLELARDIAQAFNNAFCGPLADGAERQGAAEPFPLPRTLSLAGGARVMSLRDGRKKMSKSDPDDASRINLTDSADAIRDKVRKAKTDAAPGFAYDAAASPEKANLIDVFAAVTGRAAEAVASEYATAPASRFKGDLADALVAKIGPISADIHRRMGEPGHLEGVLAAGAAAARAIAGDTMAHVRRLIGMT
jgi:tryptophanyl-tRNA synthetase